jgi:hypothetical protein
MDGERDLQAGARGQERKSENAWASGAAGANGAHGGSRWEQSGASGSRREQAGEKPGGFLSICREYPVAGGAQVFQVLSWVSVRAVLTGVARVETC